MHRLKLALNKSMCPSDDEQGINKLWPEEGKTSWFTRVKKIGEALSTPIDLLVNSKVLLNKRINESIEQSWHSAHKFPIETGHFDYRKWTETISPV